MPSKQRQTLLHSLVLVAVVVFWLVVLREQSAQIEKLECFQAAVKADPYATSYPDEC